MHARRDISRIGGCHPKPVLPNQQANRVRQVIPLPPEPLLLGPAEQRLERCTSLAQAEQVLCESVALAALLTVRRVPDICIKRIAALLRLRRSLRVRVGVKRAPGSVEDAEIEHWPLERMVYMGETVIDSQLNWK